MHGSNGVCYCFNSRNTELNTQRHLAVILRDTIYCELKCWLWSCGTKHKYRMSMEVSNLDTLLTKKVCLIRGVLISRVDNVFNIVSG